MLMAGRSSKRVVIATHISRIPAAAPAPTPAPFSAGLTASCCMVVGMRRIARITLECVVWVRRAQSSIAWAVSTATLFIGCVRAFWWVVCRVVLRIRVISAFLLRCIRIRLMVRLVNRRRREVVATWVRCLRLIVADGAGWRRSVVMAILVRCVWLAVFVIVAYS